MSLVLNSYRPCVLFGWPICNGGFVRLRLSLTTSSLVTTHCQQYVSWSNLTGIHPETAFQLLTTSNAFQLCKLWASEKVPGMRPVTSCSYSLYFQVYIEIFFLSKKSGPAYFFQCRCTLGNDCKAYDVTEPLLQQILSFSQRWRHVELPMPFAIYKKLETLISGDVLPLLYSLRGNIP